MTNKSQTAIPFSTYIEGNINADGEIADGVIILNPQSGTYRVNVIPEPGAEPQDTYSLIVKDDHGERLIAENIPVAEIPISPYNVTADFYPSPIPVTLDLKPGDNSNSVNLKSMGVTPAAIFSTQTFDARTVDLKSILLSVASVAEKNKQNQYLVDYKDINNDGLLDLIFHVKTQDLFIIGSNNEVILSGQTIDGNYIRGVDFVRIVP